MTSKNRRRGKDAERAVAELLGGARVGLMGGEDVFHPKYSIEVKSREKFIVNKWMDQCIKNNKKNKIPLVVVHTLHKSYDDCYVCIKMKDFLNLETI